MSTNEWLQLAELVLLIVAIVGLAGGLIGWVWFTRRRRDVYAQYLRARGQITQGTRITRPKR